MINLQKLAFLHDNLPDNGDLSSKWGEFEEVLISKKAKLQTNC